MPDTAQFILNRLVERVYGYPGDGIDGLMYEAVTDPEVPPPPHVRFEQAQKPAMALRGDPHTGRIVEEAIKGNAEEFLHR